MSTIVVKIGTNAMTREDSTLDEDLLRDLVRQFAQIRKDHDLVIVTSGAMGCGRTIINAERYEEITRRQLYAVVGQVKLMSIYSDLFKKYNINVAQLLATRADFENREHYLNTKNCLESLFKEKVIPIVNENDFVAIEELMFTDNDELSGMIAKMMIADKLIILTNVDGIYGQKGGIIKECLHTEIIPKHIVSADKSSFGKGGIQTKFQMAKMVSANGTDVFIANSREKDVILRILTGENVGTKFLGNYALKTVAV